MSCSEKISLNRAAVPLYLKPKSFNCMSEEYRLQPKKDCNICDACLQKREVKEHMATPLPATNGISVVKKSKCYDNILVSLLTLMLICSLFIITMMYIDEDESNIIEEFDYMPKNNWSAEPSQVDGVPKMRLPVSRISLLALTTTCDSNNICSNYRTLEEQEDGKIYEGRGWGYQSVCHDDNDLCNGMATIALIESTINSAQYIRELKLRAFVKFSISNGALVRCFRITVKPPGDQYIRGIATALNETTTNDGSCKYE
ncbi:hypothetical protein GWI33_018315 [Rhynchophorus ferrugineus]|uniref:Uncharacterized protein n=1 Tax=Rhynchophorus ferrugineus TaxID=354439 RepID=A0A834HTN0_RHYFE|nr:hypothetical protein GWI33_018315 [Rhynchophorus ferrugineus]